MHITEKLNLNCY